MTSFLSLRKYDTSLGMGIELKFKNQTLKEIIENKTNVCKKDYDVPVVDKIRILSYRFKVHGTRDVVHNVIGEMVCYLIILTGMWSIMLKVRWYITPYH